MDAFYVSVELLRRPELRGTPVVVGGTGGRGVVSAASYEARRYGVHSALSSAVARRLCPHAVFLPPDMSHYLEVSSRLQEIYLSFTPLVEPISVDEAFLDVTGARHLLGDRVEIAHALRQSILDRTGLTCSVGIATNKFLAKMASEHAKPRATGEGVLPGAGVYDVEPGRELAFLHPHPVQALWGVGPATLSRLERLGIRTVGDIAVLDEAVLRRALGESHGGHLHRLSRGLDDRAVEPERRAKSIGHEETFAHDLFDVGELRTHLVRLCDAVARRTRESGVAAGTLLLKIKFASFESVTRSVTPRIPVTTGPSMVALLEPLLGGLDVSQGVRLLGVHAQRLTPESGGTLRLFEESGDPPSVEDIEDQWQPASRAVDAILDRFGPGVIGPASALRAHRPGAAPFGPVEQGTGPEEPPSGAE